MISAARMDEDRKFPLVLIEWRDSYGCSTNWTEVGDLSPKALVCRSVGWVLHQDDDCHVIAPHLSDRNHDHAPQQACGDMTIPTQAVISVTELFCNQTVASAAGKVLRDPSRSKKARRGAGLDLTQGTKVSPN